MVELLQNLIELNTIYDRILAESSSAIEVEFTGTEIGTYEPIDGITYL
jgi:hypothetical protein